MSVIQSRFQSAVFGFETFLSLALKLPKGLTIASAFVFVFLLFFFFFPSSALFMLHCGTKKDK